MRDVLTYVGAVLVGFVVLGGPALVRAVVRQRRAVKRMEALLGRSAQRTLDRHRRVP